MPGIDRTATGIWKGTLKDGNGSISSASGALEKEPFSFATRFGDKLGTNPEELIAAAHAGCFSMALANYLDEKNYTPREIKTVATITLEGESINRMLLETEARVEGLDNEQFKRLAIEAEKKCPVSNLLRNGLEISLKASLKT